MSKKLTHVRVVAPNFVVLVSIDDKFFIREAAPLVKKFIGQPLGNLRNWLNSKFGENGWSQDTVQ